MTNPYIERAAKALNETGNHCGLLNRPLGTGDELATILDSAGLLLTPLHERALEACEKYATLMGGVSEHTMADAARMVLVAGRESLALKGKAKGARWDVESFGTEGRFIVVNAEDRNQRHGFFTESQARRVAAALNEGGE